MTEQSQRSSTASGTDGLASSRPGQARGLGGRVEAIGSVASRLLPASTTSTTSPCRNCKRIALLPSPKETVARPTTERCIDGIEKGLREIIRAICNGERPWPLVFVGSAGGGKTCAALCLADHVLGAIYRTSQDLCFDANDAAFDRLQSSNGFRITLREYWRLWEQAPLAILDEVCTRGTVTDAVYDNVKLAIDTREGSPLVFISNLSLSQITQTFDDRISSRLSAGTVCLFSGDRRSGDDGIVVAIES